MNKASLDTLCPHCGIETGIEREGHAVLPGDLRPHEFEVLVRNEWRRRLGREAYGRTHGCGLVATLTKFATHAANRVVAFELDDEVNRLIADVAAAGKGRTGVMHEVADLLKAIRSVLLTAGVDPSAASRFVSRAGIAFGAALGDGPPLRSRGVSRLRRLRGQGGQATYRHAVLTGGRPQP